MKNQIRLLLLQSLFWMLLFTVNRIIFLIYYSDLLSIDNITFNETLAVFYHAFKLDMSTFSYVLVLPFVLNIIASEKSQSFIRHFNRLYSILVLIIYQLISLGELQLYGEWKTKMSAKALSYLREPAEVIGSTTNSGIIISVSLFLILLALFIFIYNRFIYVYKLKPLNFRSVFTYPYILLGATFLAFGMRGGFQAIPITSSQSYFSKHDILNITAVNPSYNMVFSIIDYMQIDNQNIFKTIDAERAQKVVKEIHRIEQDTTISIIKTPKPNIVIILLESWSADMIESLGGDKNLTPEFRKLESEGLLFTEFYATANRSQQAMASIFSGLPGIPVTTLSDHPEKYPSVPSLVKMLNRIGFYTSFTFGGQLIYGNMKSYLVDNEFDLITEQDHLENDYPLGKLGIHDEYMFEFFEQQIGNMEQPFFASLFTLSSHSPYDFPGEKQFNNGSLEEDFTNSVFYTDKCLGEFFDNARSQDYWNNTLFIVMADHSHNTYKNHALQSFEYHKIPLLIVGGALGDEYVGKKNNKICSNVDITTTILKQLNLSSEEFPWSKNIFNPYSPEFAYFELNEGFGWKTSSGEIVVNIKDGFNYVEKATDSEKEKLDLEGRSYLQVLFDEFMGY